MSRYDWLLFLHVLSAFLFVAAVVHATYVITWSRRSEQPADVARSLRILRYGDPVGAVGAIGTLALGIWLAVDVEGYELWDGWIIAAFVLWLASGATADRSARHYARTRERADALLAEGKTEPTSDLTGMLRSSKALVLQALTVVLVLVLLLDMIWKPGA
jgi:uncharacterized membrane protein